jgi:hypothetical protein
LALTAILAACGGSSSAASSPSSTAAPTSTTTPGSTARQASFTKYTQCLTSHGVPAGTNGLFGGRRPGASASGTAPSGGSVPTGTRPTIPAKYQAAVQACASLRPTGGFGGGGFGGGGFTGAQAAAYRNCLQIHGVTLPTPSTTTPGQAPATNRAGAGPGSQVANNPKFQAARQACASLLPTRSGSTPSTTVPASA